MQKKEKEKRKSIEGKPDPTVPHLRAPPSEKLFVNKPTNCNVGARHIKAFEFFSGCKSFLRFSEKLEIGESLMGERVVEATGDSSVGCGKFCIAIRFEK